MSANRRTMYYDLVLAVEAMEPGDTLIWNVENVHSAASTLTREVGLRGKRRAVFHPGAKLSRPGQVCVWYPKGLASDHG